MAPLSPPRSRPSRSTAKASCALKWWKNNEQLKTNRLKASLLAPANASSIHMLDAKLDLSISHVIEGTVGPLPLQTADKMYGIFFDQGNGQGHCLVLDRRGVKFGGIKADGTALKIIQTSSRDMDFGPTLRFRLVIKDDMVEIYVNEYLMNLKRVPCNGQIGFLGADFQEIKAWQSK